MAPANLKGWIEQLQSADADTHNAAARVSGPMGAAAITPIADVMASSDKGAARAATQALQHVAHHSTRPGTPAMEAQRVAGELLKVAMSARPRMVRSEALNLLGFVGSDSVVPALTRLLDDKEMREDARMALERIPGPRSQRALEQALRRAPADFAPALRQSIHNHGLSMDSVGVNPAR